MVSNWTEGRLKSASRGVTTILPHAACAPDAPYYLPCVLDCKIAVRSTRVTCCLRNAVRPPARRRDSSRIIVRRLLPNAK